MYLLVMFGVLFIMFIILYNLLYEMYVGWLLVGDKIVFVFLVRDYKVRRLGIGFLGVRVKGILGKMSIFLGEWEIKLCNDRIVGKSFF